MRKTVVIVLLAGFLLSLAGCASEDGETVPVEKVSRIVAQGSVGLVNRCAGVVVSGETASISKGDKAVSDVYVAEGDWVEEGTVLFSYDMEAMELELDKLLLELDGFENTITSAQEEIETLEKQRDSAPADQQLSYSLQIQSLQADIREATYNRGLKEREVDAMQQALEDTDVRSPIAGRIMSINTDESGMEQETAFITVMDMSTYQVKGTINELNVGTLTEGMPVVIRSRLDENVTWSGVLDHIDWETQNSGQNNNSYYFVSGDETTTSTKYPFYVSLDDVTGLILGQHVYVEPDYGQREERQGIWLPEYYISDVGEAAWVWASTGRDRLEKRPVTLGEHDTEAGAWQILSGLTEDDHIAFPQEGLEPGMKTVPYEEARQTASGGNATLDVAEDTASVAEDGALTAEVG